MKHTVLFFTLLSFVLLHSCTDEKDNGVYPGRFDYAQAKIGYERVEIDLLAAGRVSAGELTKGNVYKTIVEYDDKQLLIDSICSWLNIAGLTESRDYRFKIYKIDPEGNKSAPVEVEAKPYTAQDKQSLAIAAPKASAVPGGALIGWPAEELSKLSDRFDYHSATYSYADKDNVLQTGNIGLIPSFMINNVTATQQVTVNMTVNVIPKLDGIAILDVVSFETSFVVDMSSLEAVTFTNRTIHSMYIAGGGIAIQWHAADGGFEYTTLNYTDYSSGSAVAKSLRVENTDETSIINGLKANASLEIISTYLVGGTSIDANATIAYAPALLPVSKTGWSVLSYSDSEEGGAGVYSAQNILNDDIANGWHSQWSAPAPLPPHWLVIDMLASKAGITRIKVYRGYGWEDTKTVQFYVGNGSDASTSIWELIGTAVIPYRGENDAVNGVYAQIDIPAVANTGRYLKIVCPDNHYQDDPPHPNLISGNRQPYANISAFFLWVQLPN